MKKIISLFQRNYEGDRKVRDEVVPGAEWVIAGEGIATRKYDGACCMIQDHVLYKRYDAKHGKQPPVGFQPAQDPDPNTGHWPGWLPVSGGPEDKWFRIALANSGEALEDGTYEAIGPHFQGNAESIDHDRLIRHGAVHVCDVPRTFDGIKAFFERHPDFEGIVWHHFDGRMVKIKLKDFGIKRVK